MLASRNSGLSVEVVVLSAGGGAGVGVVAAGAAGTDEVVVSGVVV
jgi:hypothetical protein